MYCTFRVLILFRFVHVICVTASCLCLVHKSIWFSYFLFLLGCCCSITRTRAVVHSVRVLLTHSLLAFECLSSRAETQSSNSERVGLVVSVSRKFYWAWTFNRQTRYVSDKFVQKDLFVHFCQTLSITLFGTTERKHNEWQSWLNYKVW